MIGDIIKETRKLLKPQSEKGVIGLDFLVGSASAPRIDFESLSRDGYERNAIIYSCINELASSAAEAHLMAGVVTKDGWEERPDSGLQKLLDNPNPTMSAYEFWFLTIMYLSIAGNMLWEKEPSKAGRTVALWPMRPDRVKIIVAKAKPGERIRQTILGYEYGFGEEKVTMGPKGVIHFKHPHPRDEIWGFPPLAACAREGDTDNSATDFVGAFFRNKAVPGGIMKVEGFLDEAERQRLGTLLRDTYTGKAGWHEILVLGKESEWISMADSFKDMDFPNLRKIGEARICAVFQINPVLIGAYVGLTEGGKYSNYEQARESFWVETLMPMYRKHADIINRTLVPEFGADMRVAWDFSGVKALQEDMNARWARATAAVNAGFITVNMGLEEIGREPLDEGGDIFLRPMLIMPVPVGEEPQTEAPKSYKSATEIDPRGKFSDEAKERWGKAVDMVARAWEGIFQKTASGLFHKEKEDILKILKREGKAEKKGAPYQDFFDDALYYLLASKDGWLEEFGPLFAGLLKAQADNIAGAFGISFDIDQPEVQEFLRGYTMKFAEGIEGVSEAKLRDIIMTAQSEGWSVPTIRNTITESWDGFERYRAEMIARTETIKSSNYGTVEAWAQAGIEKKIWLTHLDERTCGWCESMSGKTVGIRSNFAGLGDELSLTDEEGKTSIMRVDYEDIYAPPLHANCRCTIITE